MNTLDYYNKGKAKMKIKVTPNINEMYKETLSKTILSLEKEYEIIEINTITNYFGFFSHFQILIKKLHEVRKRQSTKKKSKQWVKD